jgi:hypothetical protein
MLRRRHSYCIAIGGHSAQISPFGLSHRSREPRGDPYIPPSIYLAPYKRVRRIEFSDLPKTISGKIRRVQLRALEAERRQKNEKQEWEFFEEDFPELKA